MKNTQQGFVSTLLIIILAVAIGAGGMYLVTTKKNTDVDVNSPTSTSVQLKEEDFETAKAPISTVSEIKKDLTDQQITTALSTDLSGKNKVEGIYKGDLNNDGYSDALVWLSLYSTEGEPARQLEVVVQKKDGSVESIKNLMYPYTISTWSGGKATMLDAVKIEQGILYITSSSFYDSDNWKTSNKLPKQTKKFRLVGSGLVEVK